MISLANMLSTPSLQDTRSDASLLDIDTEKMISAFLAEPDIIPGNDSAPMISFSYANDWPDPVTRPHRDGNSLSGLSASGTPGVSHGAAGHCQEQADRAKLESFLSLPSYYTVQTPRLSATSQILSGAMPPNFPNDSTQTPKGAQSLQDDMVHSLGTITSSTSFEDVMDLGGGTKDIDPSLRSSPASPNSCDNLVLQVLPRNPKKTLNGYHINLATDHAQRLADIVETSNILKAGHSGSRSLASRLSRSVFNANAIGWPETLSSKRNTSVPVSNKDLTMQQRRRLGHIAKTGANPIDTHPHSSVHGDCPVVRHHRRQDSAANPVPTLVSSPETPKTPLVKSHPSYSTSLSKMGATIAMHSFGLPSLADPADRWHDAVVVNSHDIVFVLSWKANVLYMSPSVERILGLHPKEIIGRPLVDFCHPADVGPFWRELKETTTLPDAEESGSNCEKMTTVTAHPRIDLIVRMACPDGAFSPIAITGKVGFDTPKQRKVVVCSGRPYPVPMLPWNDVRQDLLSSELSAWLKISHNGIFLGSTGPIHEILGIEDNNVVGRHVHDLPMVTSSSDLLEALRCGGCISLQGHRKDHSAPKAPVKLTVYPWTSHGRSSSAMFVRVQQQPFEVVRMRSPPSIPHCTAETSTSMSVGKRKSMGSGQEVKGVQGAAEGIGSLCGSAFQADGTSVPIMTAGDAGRTVFSEFTGFYEGSWLIELQRLIRANRRLKDKLSALKNRSAGC